MPLKKLSKKKERIIRIVCPQLTPIQLKAIEHMYLGDDSFFYRATQSITKSIFKMQAIQTSPEEKFIKGQILWFQNVLGIMESFRATYQRLIEEKETFHVIKQWTIKTKSRNSGK